MAIIQYRFELFADYHLFYLQDEHSPGDLSTSWTRQAVRDRLALAPGVIGIGTARPMTVPVRLEVHETVPPLDSLDAWIRSTSVVSACRRAAW
jgi:hypothetical protein